MGHGETLRQHHVRSRIKCHADMGARNLDVYIWVGGDAVAPVDNPILAREDGSFDHRFRHGPTKRPQEVAGAPSGVTTGKDIASMFFKYAQPHSLGCMKDGAIGNGAAYR